MASTNKPTLAFFGATGMVLRNVLATSLNAGHHCIALARNAQKLHSILEKDMVVSKSALQNLTMVEGSARSLSAVKDTLRHDVDVILSGLVSAHSIRANPFCPISMNDPTLIQDAALTIISALRELRDERALTKLPVVVPISSIGISKQRDRPYLLALPYAWLLPEVLDDTAQMEALLVKEAQSEDAVIKGYIFMRPPLLTDGPPKGLTSLRVGWTYHDHDRREKREAAPGPAIGYSISRKDLAAWIGEKAIAERDRWLGRCVSVTY